MNLTDYPVSNKPLGALYSKESTEFNVWAPTQKALTIALYDHPRILHRTLHPMTLDTEGVYSVTVEGDLHGKYYTIIVDGRDEVTDPYSISTSANGIRSAIVDLQRTNPDGWAMHTRPKGNTGCSAILYELHIKDFTSHSTSGALYKGKFLGLSENDTRFENIATGLDHLVELGITHVHLMPLYDYLTVDELDDSDTNYNWGYDPEHYNVPEGSYATHPSDPVSRIIELKMAIKALHERGLKVVLDVVYNHTYRSADSNFNVLVPNYYYRTTEEGYFSNGSGCGNEFASEHPMGRRFIVESLLYWAKEFKVDGFRFDLMALMDLDTVHTFMQELKAIDPEIIVYGEPWMGGLSTLKEDHRVYKGAQVGKGYALFNDEYRNAIKGDNDGHERGFIQCNKNARRAVQTGIAGSIPFDANHIGFAGKPSETINYFNSHDNLILTDKIRKAAPDADWYTQVKLNKLAFSVLFTSQGIPFFHAGNEFMRDKQGHHNTYNAPLSINAIDWRKKRDHLDFYRYVRDLIQLRKDFPCLRMENASDIKKHLKFVGQDILHVIESEAILYTLQSSDHTHFDCLLIAHNPGHSPLIMNIVEVVASMQCDRKKKRHVGPEHVHIEKIFDEHGKLPVPEVINAATHHLLKADALATNIFTFKYTDKK